MTWDDLQRKHPRLFKQPECAIGWFGLLDDMMTAIEESLADELPEHWPTVGKIRAALGELKMKEILGDDRS